MQTSTKKSSSILKEETRDVRCLYCSELANGVAHDGHPTCGEATCGLIVKPLPTIVLEEQ